MTQQGPGQPQQPQGGSGHVSGQGQGGGPSSGRPQVRQPEEAGRQLLAKSRDLLPVLRDKWGVCVMEGGQALQHTANMDTPGSRSTSDLSQNRFESSVEDFHSTIDQMELNLKCALETTSQSQSSSRYMIHNLSYQQYIATAKQQVTFTAQIRDMLRSAATDIVEHQPTPHN